MAEEKMRNIVRILNTDIEGIVPLEKALRRIRGIGFAMSNAICSSLDCDRKKKVGILSEKEIKTIEDLVNKPQGKLPVWMFNRRRDVETGEDLHLTTTNLKLSKENDIKMMKKIKSYKGVRHGQGLPVRGQRTRAHFRKGKKVGVAKKTNKGTKK